MRTMNDIYAWISLGDASILTCKYSLYFFFIVVIYV
jgi:hypothetical protein